MTTIFDRILADVPRLEPEFEVRIYAMDGSLVEILAVQRVSGPLYVSDIYGKEARNAIIVLFRDGELIRFIANGFPVSSGFRLDLHIADPHLPVTGNWS